jgi:hypothetical protein
MAYNITKTDGTTLVTIADGTADTSYSSLTLFGKNFAGYGPLLDNNQVHMLEHFANTVAPPNAIKGQLWWNTNSNTLNINTGANQWKVVSGPTSTTGGSNPTVTNVPGDLWWDQTNQQLNAYNGLNWSNIGPGYTATQGVSGAITTTVVDTLSTNRTVVEITVGGTVVGVISSNPTSFTTSGIPGFTVIKPGYNILTGMQYHGDADNALSLGNVLAGNFLRSDVISTTNNQLNISSDAGLTVGATQDLTITSHSTAIKVASTIAGKDLQFYTLVSGNLLKGLNISSVDGAVTVLADPTTNLGVATKHYVDLAITEAIAADDIVTNQYATATFLKIDGTSSIQGSLTPSATNTYTLGTTSKQFNAVYATTFYGTAMQSQYADLAENYVANKVYEPGTVLDFGGSGEVCLSIQDMSSRVAGVVSTKPGYLLNDGIEGINVVAIALQGRVPCKVTGKIYPGALLVSAGNGRARAEENPKVGTVIGKAIQGFDGGDGIIEVAIGRC